MTDPAGEILYESAFDVPAGDAGYYTVEVQTVAAKVTGSGLYHLDVSLEDQELFSLPLVFTLH